MPIEVKVRRRGDEHVLAAVAPDVFDDGVVVGFASAVTYVHPDKPQPELWINEVGVAPTHQRRGIGRLVMTALLGLGRREHCSEAWVLADLSNTAAHHFYASLGGDPASDDAVMFTFDL